MAEPPDPNAPTYTRDETDAQRLDRNFAELLQELRVAQAGVQILFGFLLSLAFQARFSVLQGPDLTLYLVTLIAAAIAVVCLTAPVAAHRMLFHRGAKDFLVRYAGRCAVAGLVFLSVAVLGGSLLVMEVLVGVLPALIVGGVVLALVLVLWILVPATVRRRRALLSD